MYSLQSSSKCHSQFWIMLDSWRGPFLGPWWWRVWQSWNFPHQRRKICQVAASCTWNGSIHVLNTCIFLNIYKGIFWDTLCIQYQRYWNRISSNYLITMINPTFVLFWVNLSIPENPDCISNITLNQIKPLISHLLVSTKSRLSILWTTGLQTTPQCSQCMAPKCFCVRLF